MNEIYTENGTKVNINNLRLLSTQGTETLVYNDETLVYKIFKKDYAFPHKTEDEVTFLSSMPTARILMPKVKLFENGRFVGYTMDYISHPKNIKKASIAYFLEELRILKQDIEVLSKNKVRLLDLNPSNFVYNGGMYFVDAGNYKINDIENMLYHENGKTYLADCETQRFTLIEDLDEETKQNAIRKWNYHKVNELLEEILFMHTRGIDFYTLRAIFSFFKNKRKTQGEIFNLPLYETYFDANLPVGEAVKKFVAEHIQINEKEKEALAPLMKR